MRWSFKIGTLAGIRIELHVTFILLILGLAIHTGLTTGSVLHAIQTGITLLSTFLCVLLHELGHAFAARRYGIRTRDIILLPFGGLARLERMPEKSQQEIVVAIAGPAVNVAIVGVLLLFSRQIDLAFDIQTVSGTTFGWLLYINTAMVLFNMIPAFPMDGGRVLRALLAFWLPYPQATRIAALVGQAIAVLFGIAGLVGGNTMLVFIALFVFLAASEERALVQTRASLAGVRVRDAMVTDFNALGIGDPLQRAVDHLMAGSQQDFPVVENGRLVGMLSRSDLVRELQRHGTHVAIRDVLQPDGHSAEAGEPLEEALQRMRERGRSALPVVHNGDLVGLVTLENVGDLLVVRDALRRFAGGGTG